MAFTCSATSSISSDVTYNADLEPLDSPEDMSWFACKGNNFDSYLTKGYFQRLLNQQLYVPKGNTVVLFGKCFAAQSTVWINVHHIFADIKRAFFIIKDLAVENSNFIQNPKDIECLRRNVCKSLIHIQINLQLLNYKYCNQSHEILTESSHIQILLAKLLKELKGLLLFVGRISNIASINQIGDFNTDASNSTDYYYHYFHLCLDIWWNSLAVLFLISEMFPPKMSQIEIFCNDIDELNPFAQVSMLILSDFFCTAVSIYQNSSNFSISPFICKCVQEFWFMLVHVLDKNYVILDGKMFWNVYLNVIQRLLKNNSSETACIDTAIDVFYLNSKQINFSDILGPCLWLTIHITSLYKYDIFGQFCEDKKPKSGYVVTKYIMHSLLSNGSPVSEKTLRTMLSYCIQLVLLWEPTGDILLPLTDFYIRKFDEMFCLSGVEVKDLSYLFQSSSSWFEYIINLDCSNASAGNENSYVLYLKILTILLKSDVPDGNLWRSLKGRIYSKFFPKKIRDLSEVGLQNSFTLLLAVAATGQLEVISKISELASVVETTSNPRKQSVSWKALFTLISICQQKGCDVAEIVKKIAQCFNSACEDYAAVIRDSMHKTNIMNLLLVYIDNMSDIFEKSNLNLSEYQLIGSGFSILLSSCGVTELNYILGIFLNVLERVKNIVGNNGNMQSVAMETQYVGFFQFIFNHIYPFVEKIAITNTPPPIVADIAASLTSSMYKFSSTLVNCISHSTLSIFFYFGSKENINNSIKCRYLCFILDDLNLVIDLKSKLPDFNIILFQSWLKCIVYMQPPCDSVQELTCKTLQQKEILDVFPPTKNLMFGIADHVYLCIRFFRTIGETYDKCQSFQERALLKNKIQHYFRNFVPCVAARIKHECNTQVLDHIYKLTSHLVEYCSPLLHMSGGESILAQLLDRSVFPHTIFPKDKTLQSILSSSIKEYLPSYFKGLFKLDYRNDKCIEREIKDLLVHYTGLYPASTNPVTKLCMNTVMQNPEGLSLDAFDFILDLMRIYLLAKKTLNTLNGFEVCYEVFKIASPIRRNEVVTIILKNAMELYMKHNDSLSEYLWKLMRKIFTFFKEKMDLTYVKSLLIPILQWFILEKLQWSTARGFGVLDSITEFLPEVISDIVPFLAKSIEVLEKNRGLGEDMLLRGGLRNTIAKLQKRLNS